MRPSVLKDQNTGAEDFIKSGGYVEVIPRGMCSEDYRDPRTRDIDKGREKAIKLNKANSRHFKAACFEA